MASQGSPITALLGPTNTGKTHRAVERMLEHSSGMLGFPLRLLAREVYDRLTARLGEARVALITGEEKRVPARPDYWVCTTEAMPLDQEVEFLAVDEIQLMSHPQRGHVFTARLLEARGSVETWFMGADTARPLIEQLVPTAGVRRHPRLSKLSAVPRSSLAALPPRSAVVAFSANRVYELAERVRARRGGAAVVLGALSPRARNAQVAMYQAGEVDYLVATDAIGMGLNLDVRHVAFGELRKFDGRETRELEAAELAQIAGRAGRHLTDGTFGTLAPLPELPEGIRHAIETHSFMPARRAWWRSSELDFSSLEQLQESLTRRPRHGVLRLVENADDREALMGLASREDVRARAQGAEAIELLWDVCQIPDYRKLLLDHHTTLLADIYLQLARPARRLDQDWLAERISRLDNTTGDIESLMQRMAFVRTWTYVAFRSRWLERAQHWQERTRHIEDRLSDALHERLVQRFVETPRKNARGSLPARRRKPPKVADPELDQVAANHPFSQLLALKARLQPRAEAGPEPDQWVERVVMADHIAISDSGELSVSLDDEPQLLGRLTRGSDLLHPDVVLNAELQLPSGAQLRVRRRLLAAARDLVTQLLGPLRAAESRLEAPGRGLVYQLVQGLGTVRERDARPQVEALSAAERQELKELGVVFGRELVYVRPLLKPHAVQGRRALLHAYGAAPPRLPDAHAVSFELPPQSDMEVSLQLGFPKFGRSAVRADVADRIATRLAELSAAHPDGFRPPGELASWLGTSRAGLEELLPAFGFVRNKQNGTFSRRRRRPRRSRPRHD